MDSHIKHINMCFMEAIDDLLLRAGKLVREARLNRDMTQMELARDSDMSLGALQNLESGKPVRLDTFLRALRTLNRLDVLDNLDEGFDQPSPMELLRISQKKPAKPQRASRRSR